MQPAAATNALNSEKEVRIVLLSLGKGTNAGKPVDHQEPGIFLHQGLREQMKQRRQPFLGRAVPTQQQERPGDHRAVEEVEAAQVVDQSAMGLGKQGDDDDPIAAAGVGQPALEAEDGLAGAGMALHEVQAALEQPAGEDGVESGDPRFKPHPTI